MSAPPQRCVRVIVRGRVQGVFYRATCAEKANQAGVFGWVRNCVDGSVEAHFEGSADAVETMIQWCQLGSAQALVSAIYVDESRSEAFKSFEIRR